MSFLFAVTHQIFYPISIPDGFFQVNAEGLEKYYIASTIRKTVMLRCLLYICCVVLGLSVPGNAVPFVYNLDVTQGLPSNRIYGMLVDRHGYLWMATPEGVARYNGYEVRVFDISDGLPTNDVWELFEDDKGRIWVLS